jgi:carbon-monoxide dehydrogenase medium subunit
VITAPFAYYRARDIADALALGAAHGDEAKFLAGGQSLVSMMKLRLATPAVLIDLNDIAAMQSLGRRGDSIRIGALVTHALVAESPLVEAVLPALHDAAGVIGDPQVRNRGTIGGATAHGDPSADYPAVLLALNAQLTLESLDGVRVVPADAFFLGMFETALRQGELLTEVSFAPAHTSAYEKLEHPASGYPVVGVAARLIVADSTVREARVALTGLGDAAVRVPHVESALAGIRIDDDRAVANACANVAAGIEITGDLHAPADYRAAMADVLTERVIRHAITRRGI